MTTHRQVNIRLSPEHRAKLEALAIGERVSVGQAVGILLDNAPMEIVVEPAYVVKRRAGTKPTESAEKVLA